MRGAGHHSKLPGMCSLQDSKEVDQVLYYAGWYISGIIRRMKYKVIRKGDAPEIPSIIVANHIGEFDPFYIGSLFPGSLLHFVLPEGIVGKKKKVWWLTKKELYEDAGIEADFGPMLRRVRLGFLMPALGWLVKTVVSGCNTIPVDRNRPISLRSAIKKVKEVLLSGNDVGAFGEGGMDREGRSVPIVPKLAQDNEAPIVPVFIDSNVIVVGYPFSVPKYIDDYKWAARQIMALVYSLAEEKDQDHKKDIHLPGKTAHDSQRMTGSPLGSNLVRPGGKS